MAMRHAIVVVVISAAQVTAAHAQVTTCGRSDKSLDAWQEYSGGDPTTSIGVDAVSWRDYAGGLICDYEVQVESWVDSAAGPLCVKMEPYRAVCNYQATGSYGRTYGAKSKHWLIRHDLLGEHWDSLGQLNANVTLQAPSGGGGDECDEEDRQDCEAGWNDTACVCEGPDSPILINMSGRGYRLTDAANGVPFDLDTDGASEMVAWTAPDSNDAWLAMDRNHNGKIDDGSELFGNHTPAYADGEGPTAKNGFEALFLTEGPDYGQSRHDGVIQAGDAVWPRLLLWTDRNHNGISEPDELRPAAASRLKAISTDYSESRRRDRHGNEFRQRARAAFVRRSGRETSRWVYDVWLTQAR